MKSTFGARLRAQREKKGVALVDISNQTKIKASLLEALERDDLSYWPRGLFGRAYLRSYAQAVGLDAEPLIREYAELHPDPLDAFAAAEAAAPQGVSSAIRSLLRRSDKTEAVPALPVERRHEPPAATHLASLASLCTHLQQAGGGGDLQPMMSNVAQVLDASGLVLWLWDSTAAALKPWLTHGYSSQLVAKLPFVRRDDDNAIAAAFRTGETCIVDKGDGGAGAVVVPLVGGSRCLGALAFETRNGGERQAFVLDAAVIVAALLVPFVDVVPFAAVVNA